MTNIHQKKIELEKCIEINKHYKVSKDIEMNIKTPSHNYRVAHKNVPIFLWQ